MIHHDRGAERRALRASTCVVTGGLGFIGSNLVHAQELGWTSKIDLRAGIGDTIEFYREHPWYLSST